MVENVDPVRRLVNGFSAGLEVGVGATNPARTVRNPEAEGLAVGTRGIRPPGSNPASGSPGRLAVKAFVSARDLLLSPLSLVVGTIEVSRQESLRNDPRTEADTVGTVERIESGCHRRGGCTCRMACRNLSAGVLEDLRIVPA